MRVRVTNTPTGVSMVDIGAGRLVTPEELTGWRIVYVEREMVGAGFTLTLERSQAFWPG